MKDGRDLLEGSNLNNSSVHDPVQANLKNKVRKSPALENRKTKGR